ncbi:hypothetical protein BDC45DRAFT_532104 [Circinella umbellata]|nr:hypothetical protein BDC45DRAFT_532104 [Circinella umbellata]
MPYVPCTYLSSPTLVLKIFRFSYVNESISICAYNRTSYKSNIAYINVINIIAIFERRLTSAWTANVPLPGERSKPARCNNYLYGLSPSVQLKLIFPSLSSWLQYYLNATIFMIWFQIQN